MAAEGPGRQAERLEEDRQGRVGRDPKPSAAEDPHTARHSWRSSRRTSGAAWSSASCPSFSPVHRGSQGGRCATRGGWPCGSRRPVPEAGGRAREVGGRHHRRRGRARALGAGPGTGQAHPAVAREGRARAPGCCLAGDAGLHDEGLRRALVRFRSARLAWKRLRQWANWAPGPGRPARGGRRPKPQCA